MTEVIHQLMSLYRFPIFPDIEDKEPTPDSRLLWLSAKMSTQYAQSAMWQHQRPPSLSGEGCLRLLSVFLRYGYPRLTLTAAFLNVTAFLPVNVHLCWLDRV